MSFEDFLRNKRIDPERAVAAFPLLITQMRAHFAQYGNIGTDQFYKFSFNELRKSCPLKDN